MKFSFIIISTVFIASVFLSGCIEDDEDAKEKVIEDQFTLTISTDSGSFSIRENLTIPIEVSLLNNDDEDHIINDIELIRSTLEINVTDSSDKIITHFYGHVDSPPNEITIPAKGVIKREFVIGGMGWQVEDNTSEEIFYFKTIGEYSIAVSYSNWAMNNGVFSISSNEIRINITN